MVSDRCPFDGAYSPSVAALLEREGAITLLTAR
jgi:hypothetical protein